MKLPQEQSPPTPSADAAPIASERTALELTVSYGEAVLDVRHLLPPKGFMVGDGKAVDLFVSTEHLPVSEFPLIRTEGGRFVLTFSVEQKGEVDLGDGAIHPLPWFVKDPSVTKDPQLTGCHRYTLPRSAKVLLRFEGVTVALSYVTPPERLDDTKKQRDVRYAALVFSASVAVLSVLALTLVFGSARPETYVSPPSIVADARSARLLGQADARVATFVAPPIVLGALSEDDVAKAIAPLRAEIDACLARTSGDVEARLFVDASGAVWNVVSNDGCVRGVLTNARTVPPIDGRATIDVRLR